MKTYYPTLVIGATCTAMGHVLKNPKDCLLIEASACMAWEWTETMVPGEALSDLESGSIAAILEDLKKRNALNSRGIHLPALSTYFFDRLATSGADYAFMTYVISTTPKGQGFEVQILDQGGISTLTCDRILDTSSHFSSDPLREVECSSTSIGLGLNNNSEDEHKVPKIPPIKTYQGAFEKEVYLEITLRNGISWMEARDTVHQFWSTHAHAYPNWDIATVATRLREIPVAIETGNENWLHVPAIACQHFGDAFTKGERAFDLVQA